MSSIPTRSNASDAMIERFCVVWYIKATWHRRLTRCFAIKTDNIVGVKDDDVQIEGNLLRAVGYAYACELYIV